jgi:hypothetical protein
MAKGIMGEGFINHKSKLIICVLLVMMLLSGTEAFGSAREGDLFNRGYEYYLSYQPEKAAEEFRAFLKEFPGSSVRDGVMFWLGKSSIQLKNLEEAKKSFSTITREFPGSPYIKYAKKELEMLDGALPKDNFDTLPAAAETGPAEKKDEIPGEKPTVTEKEVTPAENLHQTIASADPAVIDSGKQQANKVAPAENVQQTIASADPAVIDSGKQQANKVAPAENVQQNIAKADLEVIDSRKKQSAEEDDLPKIRADDVKILLPAGDEKKTEPVEPYGKGHDEGGDYARDSSYVLTRLDVKDVLWRRGNISEDIENERVLFDEAKKLKIETDPVLYEDLVLKHAFSPGQADYLKRYLAICDLINTKLQSIPEERMVEAIVVKYDEGNKYRKIVISPDLQREARNGVPFEEIQQAYPDLVKVVVTSYDAAEPDIKDKISYLQNDEIGATWSEDGYTILRSRVKKLSYRPFAEVGAGARDKIKAVIDDLLFALRGMRK